MNQIMENLLTRRSVRAFIKKPIPREELEEVVKAALYAPSGMGRQTWKFTVICDHEKIQKLASAIEKELGRTGYDMYDPEVLIIPSNERESRFGREDNACALENIFLAANSFGIGSVWLNQLQGICDSPGIRDMLNEFQIPDDHIVYGLAALGYPADTVPKDVQKTGSIHFVE